MRRADFRCTERLRVRWAEVDMQKIVFNGHYLMYIDTAMSAYWRALAMPYEEGMRSLGGELYVKKATLEYHGSARLDDMLDVGLRCARIGNSSLRFEAGIFAGDRLLVSGELVYVFADPATQTSRPVPAALRALIEAYEGGHEVVELRTGDWATLGPDAMRLRMAVFVEEQGIDPALEADALDAGAVHVVAYNRIGLPVATGRLLQPAPGEARIGRMAVDRAVRGQRWGRAVLDALVDAARARGDRRVTLHAQCTAENFYRRAGFEVEGERYEEAGLPHVNMGIPLDRGDIPLGG
ncbi:YbgC/FadM family acyl-CoA thioesterase [Acidovorax sp. NCPPB 3859]|nr:MULTISPECIES: YbgC/FadM family acyl-CoA thioesterase [unclassified Acidovorax]MDA8449115.1 YbgC/FadM family acyl-CoA thioesterase [Acidovorax sp. GBBC 3297]MDA8458797.1 YbgC/FadM family acyl-CoA thioesterase [Acidovorax sp. GBBC 3333]MDA8463871.1 YbgC/FadM family acyl-CoA thioesterase [Acidovorax sp. GBBC 3332]MDA8468903.1 YbgC/FadM family acyl-CoA thioesterase [Acidovorax sp. GBBC 3299]WCM80510.1 YbgC/FadM family acyl-CoA thioesterase [Acidovorax sp. GBBC 712]